MTPDLFKTLHGSYDEALKVHWSNLIARFPSVAFISWLANRNQAFFSRKDKQSNQYDGRKVTLWDVLALHLLYEFFDDHREELIAAYEAATHRKAQV